MLFYRTSDRISGWLKEYCFHLSREEKVLYLTFDDGPHPEITQGVMNLLAQYRAKATFFCVGQNLERYPEMVNQLDREGHKIGNHTYQHLNGWKTGKNKYIENFQRSESVRPTTLFRPPYGKIRPDQGKVILKTHQIVLWDVLSGDFNQKLTPDRCTRLVTQFAREGSVVVFHDSEKAMRNMFPTLKGTLEHFSNLGYRFETLPETI